MNTVLIVIVVVGVVLLLACITFALFSIADALCRRNRDAKENERGWAAFEKSIAERCQAERATVEQRYALEKQAKKAAAAERETARLKRDYRALMQVFLALLVYQERAARAAIPAGQAHRRTLDPEWAEISAGFKKAAADYKKVSHETLAPEPPAPITKEQWYELYHNAQFRTEQGIAIGVLVSPAMLEFAPMQSGCYYDNQRQCFRVSGIRMIADATFSPAQYEFVFAEQPPAGYVAPAPAEPAPADVVTDAAADTVQRATMPDTPALPPATAEHWASVRSNLAVARKSFPDLRAVGLSSRMVDFAAALPVNESGYSPREAETEPGEHLKRHGRGYAGRVDGVPIIIDENVQITNVHFMRY